MKDSVFYTKHTLNFSGKVISLQTPLVMGILNITPDSFYPGGRIGSMAGLLANAEKMLQDGATILDTGGYSSRPGATHITQEEELPRVIPAIKALVAEFPGAIISVDTFRAEVARQAVDAGAKMINDISAGEADDNMFGSVAAAKVPYVAMHMKGTPQTMVSMSQYEDILTEIKAYFYNRLFRLRSLGVKDVIIDPGFGFSKTREQSFFLLNNLEIFDSLNAPVLVGISRKSLISKTLNTDSENALNGTTVLNTIAIVKRASILRVHDVKEAVEIIKLTSELQKEIK